MSKIVVLASFYPKNEKNNEVKERIQPLRKKLHEMVMSMNISKNLNSNQGQSFRSLAQVARSVPSGVIPQKIEYDGEMHSAANLFDAMKEGYYGKF